MGLLAAARRKRYRSEGGQRRQPPKVDGGTPLQWAVYEGDIAEVRRLPRLERIYPSRITTARPRWGSQPKLNTEIINCCWKPALTPTRPTQANSALLSREPAMEAAELRAWRQNRCAERFGGDSADVGVCAPAPADDAVPDLQRRRRQCPLHCSRLPASRASRGTSQESGLRRSHAFAVCRARELSGLREVVAQ